MLTLPPAASHRRRPLPPVPPPPAPPPAGPAWVVSATVGPDGVSVTLVFDRPLVLIGPSPYEMDGSVQFGDGGAVAAGVNHAPADTLTFDLEGTVEAGEAWAIVAQPAWLGTPVAVPQSGEL